MTYEFIWWALVLFLALGTLRSVPSLLSELKRSRGFRSLRYHVPADGRRAR